MWPGPCSHCPFAPPMRAPSPVVSLPICSSQAAPGRSSPISPTQVSIQFATESPPPPVVMTWHRDARQRTLAPCPDHAFSWSTSAASSALLFAICSLFFYRLLILFSLLPLPLPYSPTACMLLWIRALMSSDTMVWAQHKVHRFDGVSLELVSVCS